MDAAGIDWKGIAMKQREEFLAAQAAAKALAQQERFEEAASEEAISLADAGVSFQEEILEEPEEMVDDVVIEAKASIIAPEVEKVAEKEVE